MKKIIPLLIATLVFITLIIAWEIWVAHWEATQHTGGAVIRVDIFIIYPLAFLLAVGGWLILKRNIKN